MPLDAKIGHFRDVLLGQFLSMLLKVSSINKTKCTCEHEVIEFSRQVG